MIKDATLGAAIRDSCYETAYTLNRNYIVTVLTKDALDRYYGTMQKRKRSSIKVKFPSHEGGITEKTAEKAVLTELLQKSLDFDIYKHSLITAVSAVEDLLSNILRLVLRRFPERLNASVAGEKVDKTVKMSVILESTNLDELRDRLVERRVLQVFYESPQNYFEQFTVVSGFKIPPAARDNYIEIKATRDVLIHHRGIINRTYLEKAGANARGKLGDEIALTEAYFADSIGNLKKLLPVILREMRRVYGVEKIVK
jgi:hypothetical protein